MDACAQRGQITRSKQLRRYMDKTSDTIRITKDNISTYFPKLKWIDVDYEHGFQPSN